MINILISRELWFLLLVLAGPALIGAGTFLSWGLPASLIITGIISIFYAGVLIVKG